MNLHMFQNECEIVIASSPEDAEAVHNEMVGGDYERDDYGDFKEIDDAVDMPVTDEDTGETETMTVAAWVQKNGRGYFAETGDC